tara:strand:- start:764 stop:1087 length:324 start_codon:yes stop_codon:yes gene_type:complete
MINETATIKITVKVAEAISWNIDCDNDLLPEGIQEIRIALKSKIDAVARLTKKTTKIVFTYHEILQLEKVVSDMITLEMWGRMQKWIEILEEDIYAATENIESRLAR